VTTATLSPGTGPQAGGPRRTDPARTVRLVPAARSPVSCQDHSPAAPARGRAARSWPLLIRALPAATAVWSGWAGIGQLTGFGQIHPMLGIWDSLHLDTAITLPVGVEAYAPGSPPAPAVSDRTRRFARRSATGSLLLGVVGQAAYHLLTQARVAHAPWPVTTVVSCLPDTDHASQADHARPRNTDANGPGMTPCGAADGTGSA
jgi:hypothetical protein